MDQDDTFGTLLFKHIAAKKISIDEFIEQMNARLAEAKLEFASQLITNQLFIGWQTHTIERPSEIQFGVMQDVLITENAAYTAKSIPSKIATWRSAYENYEIRGAEFAKVLGDMIIKKHIEPHNLIDEFEAKLKVVLGIERELEDKSISVDYLARITSNVEVPSQATATLLCKTLGLEGKIAKQFMERAKEARLAQVMVAFPHTSKIGAYYPYRPDLENANLNVALNNFYRIKSKIVELLGEKKAAAISLWDNENEGNQNKRFSETVHPNSCLAPIGQKPITFLSTLVEKGMISANEKDELAEFFTQLKGAIKNAKLYLSEISESEATINTVPEKYAHPNFTSGAHRTRFKPPSSPSSPSASLQGTAR